MTLSKRFDESHLKLVYQEKTAAGEKGNFNRLIHPELEKQSKSSRKKIGSKKYRAA